MESHLGIRERKKCPGNQSKQDGEISNIQGVLKVRYKGWVLRQTKQHRMPRQEVNWMKTKKQGEKSEPAIIPDWNYGGKFILLFRLTQSCFLGLRIKKKKKKRKYEWNTYKIYVKDSKKRQVGIWEHPWPVSERASLAFFWISILRYQHTVQALTCTETKL